MPMDNKYAIDKRNVTYRIIDGDAVILNLDNGHYYSLNGIGTRIWEAMEKGAGLSETVGSLSEEYGVAHKEVEKDAAELVRDLEKEGLIINSSSGA